MSADLKDLLLRHLSQPIASFLLSFYLRTPPPSPDFPLGRPPEESIVDGAARRTTLRIFSALGDSISQQLQPALSSEWTAGHGFTSVLSYVAGALSAGVPREWFLQRRPHLAALEVALRSDSSRRTASLSRVDRDIYERTLAVALRLTWTAASMLPPFESYVETGSIQRLGAAVPDIEKSLGVALRIELLAVSRPGQNAALRHEADYRHEVVQGQDYLELFGADIALESRRHSLNVGYISLSLAQRAAGGADESRSLPVEALLQMLHPDAGRLLIRGEAGSGKSTLFRWIALQAAKLESPVGPSREELDAHSWQRCIPFLIRLRDCHKGKLPDPEGVPALVSKLYQSARAEWVTSVLKSARGLVLLDGIDELPGSSRAQIRVQFQKLVLAYSGNYFLVSTRPEAVPARWLDDLGFREARVNPMPERSRAQLIDKWHQAVASELAKQGKPAGHLVGLASSLKEKLADNPALARLATNPLLCAMICALHRERNHILPESQSELCEALCQVLLHRREAESGLDLSDFPPCYRVLTYEQKRAIVQGVAFFMVQNSDSSIEARTAERKIADSLERLPSYGTYSAEEVCRALVERSGLLREPRPGFIDFIHNTFKEFLAAERLVSDEHIGQLADKALDAAWEPVLLFAAATRVYGFTSRLIERILAADGGERRQRILVALRCRSVALDLDPSLGRRLDQLREELFPPESLADAEGLAMGGDAVVPYLGPTPALSAQQASACVRALRLIGTSRARQVLREHLDDTREAVVEELAQAVDPLEIPAVRKLLRDRCVLPTGIAAQVTSLARVGAISELSALDLTGTRVADLRPLAQLRGLRRLTLGGEHLDDLSALNQLSALEEVSVHGLRTESQRPDRELVDMPQLRSLRVEHSLLRTLDLSRLTQLEQLCLISVELDEGWAPLRDLANLQGLEIRGAPLNSLGFISGMERLRELVIDGARIEDLEPCADLQVLTRLSVTNGPLKDIKALRGLHGLKELSLTSTQVGDLSSLADLEHLAFLDVVGCPVRDLSPARHVKRVLSGASRERPQSPGQLQAVESQGPVGTAPRGPADVAILVPLKEEWDVLHAMIGVGYEIVRDSETRAHDYWFERDGLRCVATFLGDMGETSCALATQRLLQFRPRIVVLLGIGGAMDAAVSLGDVVVGDIVDSYLVRAKAIPARSARMEFELSGDPYRCSASLLNEVQNWEYAHSESHWRWQQQCAAAQERLLREHAGRLQEARLLASTPRLHRGHIACGPVVAAATKFKRFLRERRDRTYLAIEMESAGLLAAVWKQSRACETMVLRGISDTADEDKAQLDRCNHGALRQYAMASASSLLLGLLASRILAKSQTE